MDTGRIHALLLATSAGNVVYERFYERLNEQDKAEMRASLAEAAAAGLARAPEQTEFCTRYRDANAAIRKEGDLQYFAVGTGEYNALNLAEILRALAGALAEVLKRPPSEQLLFDNYGRLCLVVDEMVHEGILDKTEPEAIQRGISMKAD